MGWWFKHFSFFGAFLSRSLLGSVGIGVAVLLSHTADAKEHGYRVTCRNMDAVMMRFNDGRSRGLCEEAMTACHAQTLLQTLPEKNPLKINVQGFLGQKLDKALALCNLGILGYNPDLYESIAE